VFALPQSVSCCSWNYGDDRLSSTTGGKRKQQETLQYDARCTPRRKGPVKSLVK
jgi:hypothetical protein